MRKRIFEGKLVDAIIADYMGGKGGPDIAVERGCSVPVIYKLLRRAGIEPAKVARARGSFYRAPRRFTEEEERKIASDYLAGFSLRKLESRYDTGHKVLGRILKRQKVETRPQRTKPADPDLVKNILELWDSGAAINFIKEKFHISDMRVRVVLTANGRPYTRSKGDKHHRWKGGRWTSSDGYIRVRLHPANPFFCMAQGDGTIMEHRLVMAERLGRPLEPREQVHHINGKRDDNRLENLQLRKGNHGSGSVHRCNDCGSYNIVTVDIKEGRE